MMRQCWIAMIVTLLMNASVPSDEPDADHRKAEQSQFAIRDFNALMMAAVDNSSNQVKFATPPGEYRVWGQVLDEYGDPVKNAQVMLGGPQRGLYAYLANFDVTDDDGRFVLQGAPDKQTVFVNVDGTVVAVETAGKTDVTARMPAAHVVAIYCDDPLLQLYDDSIRLRQLSFPEGGVRVVGDVKTTLATSQAGTLLMPAGRYLVTAYRMLTFEDKTERGWTELGEIEVEDTAYQTMKLGARAGTKVSGVIRDYSSRAADALGIRMSIYSAGDGGSNGSRTLDTIACAADGSFEFHRVPAGSWTIAATTIPRPKPQQQSRPFFGGSNAGVRLEERVVVSGDRVNFSLPILRDREPTTVGQVHAILDSTHPTPNVSWSWHDVQVMQLRQIKDRDGTIAELHRLLRDHDCPPSWRWLVLDALWRIHPISEATKEILVEAMHDPINFDRRSSILGTLTNMKSGALEYLDLIIHMRHDDDWRVRYGVARAMNEIGGTQYELSDAVVDTAVGLLNDPHGEVRKQAAGTLGSLQSPRATEALKTRMHDPFQPARAMAAWALWECSGEVEPALTTMMELLQNGDFEGRKEAANYLEMFDYRAADALPLLRANATYEKKPPFRGTRETIRYQLRRVAESTIETIEAGIAWQSESAPFNPHPQRGPIADAGLALPDESWGPEIAGLQFSLAVDSDAHTFSSGERVPLRMYARNSSEQPVRFQLDRRLPGASPSLKREKQRVYVRSVRLLVAAARIDVTLGPGGIVAIPHTGLFLGENPLPRRQLWHPNVKDASSGSYQMSQRLWIHVFDQERKTKNALWYETGSASFTVASPDRK